MAAATGRGDLQVALRRVAMPKRVALRALISVGDLEIAAPRSAIRGDVPLPDKDVGNA